MLLSSILKVMKKILFGIFAHPDDEGFGPSGTLYKLAQSGVDIHLLLITDGAAGRNEEYNDLAQVRFKEWEASNRLIGTTSHRALHYPDGGLSNDLYLKIADEVLALVTQTLRTYSTPLQIDFITFDQNGLSGHLDHIATSFITTFVFERLRSTKQKNITWGHLKYFCLPKPLVPHPTVDWIFMPAGKPLGIMDEIVDISDVFEQKLRIMQAHVSQRQDMEMILAHQGTSKHFQHEHFLYYKS